MSEVLVWLERVVALVPSLMGLWKAAETGNAHAELAAQADLLRAVKDRQAHERIHGAR